MMQEKEINRLNNIIRTQNRTIQTLTIQKSQLEIKNADLNSRVNHLQTMLKDDPITKILNSIEQMRISANSLQAHQRSTIINDKLTYQYFNKTLVEQTQIYKNQLNIKNKHIQALTLQISELKQIQYNLKLQNVELRQNIHQYERKLEKEKNQNQILRNQRKQKKIKQKQQLHLQSRQLQEEKKKIEHAVQLFQQQQIGQRNKLVKERHKLINTSQFQYEEIVENLIKKNKQHEAIMQQMGVQLDQRNEELAKLMSIEVPSQKDNLTLQESALKITNKFLKSELKKKSEFIKNILMRLKDLDSLNSIQQNQNKKLQKQLNQLRQFKQKNKELQRVIKRLTLNNQIMEQKIQQHEHWQNESMKNMYLMLLQNESYHQYMKYQFGINEGLKEIQKRRIQMENQMLERGKNQKWVSIEELIRMNRKLMQRN